MPQGRDIKDFMRAVETHPKERGERMEQLNHAMHLRERLGYTYYLLSFFVLGTMKLSQKR